MSKSLGNVVDPRVVIEGGANLKEQPAYGADTLRMWVSGVDYSGDVCVGANIMKQVSESYRKLRNTMRYLLGSLHDFNPAQDSIAYAQLPAVDKYLLGTLTAVVEEVELAYEGYQFYKANQALLRFASVDLSAFYLDLAKDRLYIPHRHDPRRRSCQTVLQIVLEQMAVMMAPLVPHLAEEVWQSLPYLKPTLSVFEQSWMPTSNATRFPSHQPDRWKAIIALRNDVNKCIELARQAKLVGASMECAVYLHTGDAPTRLRLQQLQGDERLLAKSIRTNAVDDLRFLLMASQVHVCESEDDLLRVCADFHQLSSGTESGVTVGVAVAKGKKCERCWYYCESVGEDHVHDDLCQRCAGVVGGSTMSGGV
jgi:isoleucyl-tRNA synthetase